MTESAALPITHLPGVTLDDAGRLDLDLACWSCDYNLRTLALDAACPECGMPVAITLEHRDGRKTRPFSLYTLHPVMRMLGMIYGMIGPAFIVFIAAVTPMDPISVDWQSGELRDYIGVMLAGRSMYPFHPFLAWAYIAYAALMVNPIPMGRKWWVRVGLVLGCLLGLQYQLIIFGNLFSLTPAFFVALVFGLIPVGVLASVVWGHAVRDETRPPRTRDKRSMKDGGTMVGVAVGVLIVIAFLTQGIILAPILFAGPYLMLMCMGAALCRVYRTDFDEPMDRSKPVSAGVVALGYAAAWPIAINQAQIVYSSLPLQDPSCYVCTASARGHRWLTRAEIVRFTDGKVMLVTKQMRTLKAGELLLAERLPRLHRALRAVYDVIGPCIARHIRSPWLADVSYLLFVPLAVVTSLVLRLSGRSREIEQVYQR